MDIATQGPQGLSQRVPPSSPSKTGADWLYRGAEDPDLLSDNDPDDDGGGKENEEAAAEGPEARLMRARWPERKEAVRAVQQFATSQGKQAKVTKVNGGSSI